MKIGSGYGRRAALAALASVGLVVLIGCPHMRNLVISTAAQASPTRPPAVSDGQDQVKPGASSAAPPASGLAPSPGAGVANPLAAFVTPAANGIRNLGHVCNWDTQDWDDLTDPERQAFQILGWSRDTWDGDNEDAASASGKAWSKLTPKERNAANLSATARKIGTFVVRVTFPSDPARKSPQRWPSKTRLFGSGGRGPEGARLRRHSIKSEHAAWLGAA